jgi:hypothetical protein
MLRGAIDHTTPNTVSGWIYSPVKPMHGETVLAFVDGVCIGAGKVELFRQDLLDAGLDDGHLGFHFGITPLQPRDVARAYVTLEGSNFAVLQPGARIGGAEANRPFTPRPTRSLPSLEWMRERGWLEQSDFDFLKIFNQFGVFDQMLRPTKKAAANGVESLDPAAEAKTRLELLSMQHLSLIKKAFDGFTALAAEAASLAAGMVEPVVAIWSEKKGSFLLVEDSHNDDANPGPDSLTGAVEYVFGPDRLVFLDLRSRFGVKTAATDGEILVFLPG